jgi:hypothetical protein
MKHKFRAQYTFAVFYKVFEILKQKGASASELLRYAYTS